MWTNDYLRLFYCHVHRIYFLYAISSLTVSSKNRRIDLMNIDIKYNLHSIRRSDIPFVISTVYFWLSIFFIIGRTMSTLFIAASIHDASRKPIVTLRNVPSIAYSLEVQRFTYQVVTGLGALSGKRFFFLTRKLILAVSLAFFYIHD